MIIKREEVLNSLNIDIKNTGSTEFQITSLTEKINNLNSHLSGNHKDNSGKRGLMVLVNKRKKLISYLKRKNFEGYKALIKELGLRK